MRNTIKTGNLKTKSFKTLRNYILIGICAVLAISSILITIETATVGLEMAKIEKTQNLLSNQKRDLQETLVRTLSITELQQKGIELGFLKAMDLVYVANAENLSAAPVANLP
jgi:hypothetical protein